MMPSNRIQAPKPHPDWFWSLSGGVDSTAAFLLTKDALRTSEQGGNFSKKPVAVYFDTRIGVPLNLLYIQELCDIYDVQLWTLRTEEKFEEWVENDGHPGPGAHPNVRNELKIRQASKLNTLADTPVHVLGLLAEESDERAQMAKVEQKDRHVEVRPVHRLSKVECARIILEHEECPINPLWMKRHFTDCGCGANGDPSELRNLEEDFPWFAQRLREIEESANHNDATDTWGWGGLSAEEQKHLAHANDSGQMSLCSPGCTRKLDQEIVDAFVERVDNGPTAAQEMLANAV